jgi:hypothetical protein
MCQYCSWCSWISKWCLQLCFRFSIRASPSGLATCLVNIILAMKSFHVFNLVPRACAVCAITSCSLSPRKILLIMTKVCLVSVNHFASPKALHDLFSLFFEFESHTELSFLQLCFVSLVFVLLLWGTWLLVALLLFLFFVRLSCYHGEPSCSWLSLSWLPCCFSFFSFCVVAMGRV